MAARAFAKAADGATWHTPSPKVAPIPAAALQTPSLCHDDATPHFGGRIPSWDCRVKTVGLSSADHDACRRLSPSEWPLRACGSHRWFATTPVPIVETSLQLYPNCRQHG